METIRIFIASSFELNDWRVALGDTFREWSDLAECHGFRIRMECWEDYHPEFTGKRKQSEYNEELVKPSNLFFALFRTICGNYTKEEVRTAQQYVESGIHIIRHMISSDSKDVDDYMATLNDNEKVHKTNVYTFEELKKYISEVTYRYILTRPNYIKEPITIGKTLYATVGKDMFEHRCPLGNIVRTIDNISESYLGVRCRLKRDNIYDISVSDYYIGLLKNDLSEENVSEIEYAIANTNPSSHPSYSVLYYKHKDKAIENNPKLRDLILGRGVFKEEFDNLHRIKYNLLVWMLSQRLASIDNRCGIRVSGGIVKYRDMNIIPVENLEIQDCSDEEALIILLNKIRQSLLSTVLNASDSTSRINIKELDKEINRLFELNNVTKELQQDIIRKQISILSRLNSRISYLMEDISQEKALEIAKLCIRKRQIEKSLLECGKVPAIDLIRTEMLIIKLCNQFPDLAAKLGLNEDLQFGLIVSMADSNNISTPEIEAIRMNYGNYLSRSNRHREAQLVYDTARMKLEALDDGSALMVEYLPPIYLNQIHSLSQLGQEYEATLLVEKFEQNIGKWNKSGFLSYPVDAYEILTISARLSFRNSKLFKNYIGRGNELWHNIEHLKCFIPESERVWDDVFCYFPLVLCAAIVDSDIEPKISLKDAQNIAFKAFKILDSNSYIEKGRVLSFKAQLNHNLSKAASNAGLNAKARMYGLRALELRKHWFEISPNAEIEREIASNLLMIGATYINGRKTRLTTKEYIEALTYADRSLEIFMRLNDGYLEHDTQVKEAELLKGTIFKFTRKHQDEGVRIIENCQRWNIAHPKNTYRDVFLYEYQNRMKGPKI